MSANYEEDKSQNLDMDRPYSEIGNPREFNENAEERNNLSLMDNLRMSNKIPKIPKKNVPLSKLDYKRIKNVVSGKSVKSERQNTDNSHHSEEEN